MNKASFKFGIKEILTIAGLILVLIITIIYWRDISAIFSKKEEFISRIKSFGPWGFLIFILVQIIQVVIFVIPGEVVQVAGGYLYGTLLGSVLSVIGITLGSLMCFQIARILGQPLLEKFVPKEKMDKMKDMINTPKASMIIFSVFIIPGLPKDLLSYVAGLTPIRFVNFFVVSLIARSPWIIVSSYWGSNLADKDYKALIIVAAIATLAFLIGVIKGESIVKYLSEKGIFCAKKQG